MAIPDFLSKAAGTWHCKSSKLIMHDHPDRFCESTLKVEPAVLGRYAILSYSWKCDGKEQEGVLLLGVKKEDAVASFVDSFHTSGAIMPMRGEKTANAVSLQGSYAAPPGPDWKWRFAVSGEAGKIRFTMTNISPAGEEYPAVEAVYERK